MHRFLIAGEAYFSTLFSASDAFIGKLNKAPLFETGIV